MNRSLKNSALALSVAVAAVVGGPVYAETAKGDFVQQVEKTQHMASDWIGQPVYNGATQDAEMIGDINNIVLSADGQVESIVVGVGGFLGMGEKNVALPLEGITLTTMPDGEKRAVIETSREALEAAPEVVMGDGEEYVSEQQVSTKSQSTDMKDGISEGEKLAEISPSTVTPENMIGQRVYTISDDDWVGEVGDVVMGADGKIEKVIVDFGGFLGIGEKDVAVPLSALSLRDDGDADGDYYVYVDYSREELEAAPEYQSTQS
ncbi:MAG: PRC-barrel domain-containing protein [Neomegalonema sp.]|nr:PRC-barrel domain-containing protein [Neomegalonema sp.]